MILHRQYTPQRLGSLAGAKPQASRSSKASTGSITRVPHSLLGKAHFSLGCTNPIGFFFVSGGAIIWRMVAMIPAIA